MSITATIALSASTVNTGQKVTATVTVTNASASAVTITDLRGRAMPTGTQLTSVAVEVGTCTAGKPGFTVTVPGGNGTATAQFDLVPEAPLGGTYASNPFPSGVTPQVGLATPAQQLIDIGADVLASDGSTCSATVATLTVNGPTR